MAITEQHKRLQARVETVAQLVPLPDISFRPMFGGLMIYNAGKPFASLSEPGLSIKLSESDRQLLLQEEGAEPLRHEGEAPSKQYIVVPPQILENDEQLSVWLQRSTNFVSTLPNKQKKHANPS